jgi:hypothetical protein
MRLALRAVGEFVLREWPTLAFFIGFCAAVATVVIPLSRYWSIGLGGISVLVGLLGIWALVQRMIGRELGPLQANLAAAIGRIDNISTALHLEILALGASSEPPWVVNLRDRITQPVFRHLFARQARRPTPIVVNLDLEFSSLAIEQLQSDSGNVLGEVLAVKIVSRWDALLPERHARLCDIVVPIVLSPATSLEASPEMRELVEAGRLGFYYPIPMTWVRSGRANEEVRACLRKMEWFSVDRLTVGATEIEGYEDTTISLCETSIKATPYTQGVENLLREFQDVWPDKIVDSDLAWVWSLADKGIRSIRVGESERAEVSMESTYRIWISDQTSQSFLYRYEVPFARPTCVRTIEFDVGRLDNDVRLAPAVVRCGFRLLSSASRDDEKTQRLEWDKQYGSGRPFSLAMELFFLGLGMLLCQENR